MDVEFVPGAEEGSVLLRSEGRGYDVRFGVLAEPDGILLPWAVAGGLVDDGCLPEVDAAAKLPVFEDTRQRFSSPRGCDAATALFRFALCRERGHARRCDYRVLCPDCLAGMAASYAQGAERALALDAVRRLRALSAQDARERSR